MSFRIIQPSGCVGAYSYRAEIKPSSPVRILVTVEVPLSCFAGVCAAWKIAFIRSNMGVDVTPRQKVSLMDRVGMFV